jgi:acyl-coenzyme A thioesterase PaaI-like protein
MNFKNAIAVANFWPYFGTLNHAPALPLVFQNSHSARELGYEVRHPCDWTRVKVRTGEESMDATQEDVMGLNRDAGLEILSGELEARLQVLEKAQRRADHELLDWKMQAQLADEAMYAAGILEASAEQENRLAAIDLQTLERIDHLLVADAGEVLARSSPKGLLKAAKSSLEALSERQVDAYLKLQICRKHCQLQRRILDQCQAALARAEQRSSAIGEEVGVLRNELGRHREKR